ncbi:pilin [Enterovibrio norvegicus]|uniref:pilin n=1 Tax=Enterovibrio norvegicus TaxID=188144 RepID=UPI000C844DA1|nr:pilin [Enterovibrio norvegicus]PMH67141.1 hypothetical protein BCU62_07990 [Enterovibrio norvegicus]
MKKQKGFSLIELLIVVGIIGALTAIAVPQYQKYTEKSDIVANMATLHNMKSVVEAHLLDNPAFPKKDEQGSLGIPTTVTMPTASTDKSGTMSIGTALKLVTLTRTDDGLWSCAHGNADLGEINGCKAPEEEEE